MKFTASLALLGLGLLAAAPLDAQIRTTNDRHRTRIPGIPGIPGLPIPTDGRVDTRTDARIEHGRRGPTKVPKGHLPPPGMCRVWVDGVPPGQQPAATDCATAESQRIRFGTDARVIYGDRESFPGRGKDRLDRRHDADDDDDDDDFDDDDRVESKDREERGKAHGRGKSKGRSGKGR